MRYVGNLTCGDCGLTFTARWGSNEGVDQYRCERDHVVEVDRAGYVVTVDGMPLSGSTLAELRGRCPLCSTGLATGLLPACPVCDGRDHDVAIGGTLS